MMIVLSAILAFTYRLRGGGFVTLPDTFYCRAIWSFIVGGVSFAYFGPCFTTAWLAAGSFLSLLVPHGYAQNVGRWPSPQEKWPSFFVPEPTQERWDAMNPAERGSYDALLLAAVAFWRGLIVFAPLAVLDVPIDNILLAMFFITGLHPMAYVFGWEFPWSLGKNLREKSTDWAELFTGFAWGFCLYLLTW